MRKTDILLLTLALGSLSMNAHQGWTTRELPQSNRDVMGFMKKEVVRPAESERRTPFRESEEPMFTVTCMPVEQPEWSAMSVKAYQDGFVSYYPDGTDMRLPGGTYDFMAVFEHTPADSYQTDHLGIVILENIVVDQDMTLDFDPAAAVNKLQFKPLTPAGEAVTLTKVRYDSDFNREVIEEGNVKATGLSVNYLIGTDGWYWQMAYLLSAEISDSEYGIYDPTTLFDIYINEVSDHMNIALSCILSDTDKDPVYVISADQKGSTPGVISNDYAHYIDTEMKATWTPGGSQTLSYIEENSLSVLPYGLSIYSFGGDEFNSRAANNLTQSCSHHIMVSSSPDSYQSFIIAPMMTEVYYSDGNFMGVYNYGGYTMYSRRGQETACLPSRPMPTNYVYNDAHSFSMPGCGAFTGSASDNLEVNFATSPALFSLIDCWVSSEDGSVHPEFHLSYTGRLDEMRNTDKSFMECTAELEGEIIARNLDELNDYFSTNYASLHGSMKISLTDSNCEINGKTASNRAEVTINLDNADYFPPTLSMLQFRDEKEQITSSFVSGRLSISASDINFDAGQPNHYSTDSPSSVVCEYAPTGSGDFKELELTMHTEFYEPQILGENFSASLSSAIGAPGWYDLRVTVTDDAGNTQMQTIGMAFELKESNLVDRIDADNVGDTVEYYTIDGIRIDGDAVAPGLYVGRRADGSAYKIRIR